MSNRDKFEAWYLENWGHTEDNHETLFERSPDDEYGYYRLGVRMSHKAWQEATELSAKQLVEPERYGRQADITIENLERKVEQLAAVVAENVLLKDAHQSAIDAVLHPRNKGAIYLDRTLVVSVKTPSTDAILAEVRASGVEMLADHLRCPDLDETIRDFAAQLRQGAK